MRRACVRLCNTLQILSAFHTSGTGLGEYRTEASGTLKTILQGPHPADLWINYACLPVNVATVAWTYSS